MKKIIQTLTLIVLANYSYSQVNDALLADTVIYITNTINELESSRVKQEAYRLNFDDCNLEFVITNTDNESWSIESFWMNDIDKDKIRITFNEKNDEWELKLECASQNKGIKGISAYSKWNTSELFIHSSKKESLTPLAKALYYAIENCSSR